MSEDNRTLGSGEHCGYRWLIKHNFIGFRCGYVCVPPGHIWFNRSCKQIHKLTSGIEIHGGLTFSGKDEQGDWWVGFDCAHEGDAPEPSLVVHTHKIQHIFHSGVIRTQKYVKVECLLLCEYARMVV